MARQKVILLADPSSPATDPASPPKISKRMKNHPHMPPAKPTHAPPWVNLLADPSSPATDPA